MGTDGGFGGKRQIAFSNKYLAKYIVICENWSINILKFVAGRIEFPTGVFQIVF